jgi:O-antigen/teichoic acid export membrane protein
VTPGTALPDAPRDRLVRSTVALLVSNATGAALGIAFWAVAARLYVPRDVGYGVAAIAAMTLLANIAQLNLGMVFPRYLHAAGARSGAMLCAGYAASVALALVAGTVFLTLTGPHDYLGSGTLPSLAFLAAVVLWVVFTIEDAALIGLRTTTWVPVENAAFSVLKIALLPLFVVIAPRSGVFYSWILPLIVCVIPISYYLFRRVLPAHVRWSSGRSSLPSPRTVRSMLIGEYLGGLSVTAIMTIPALLVTSTLGAAQAAYFQTPWLAGTSFDFLLYTFAATLLAESSARPTVAVATVRRAVRLAVCLLAPGLVLLVIGAPWFLRILGPAYAAHGTRLLQALVLALPFMAINVAYVTYARLARRVRRIVVAQVTLAALILGLTAVLLAPLGIAGVGVAFLAGQAALAAVVAPSVIRQYRSRHMSPSFAPEAALIERGRGPGDRPVPSSERERVEI